MAQNHDKLHEAANYLAATLAVGTGVLLVRGHGIDQWAWVKLAGSIRSKPATGNYLEWQINLKAIDPYKYGELRSFSAPTGVSFDVYHRGTVSAWPILTITGDMPDGYKVSLGGKSIEVSRPISAGQTHTIDTRTGLLRVNGSVVSGGVGDNDMFKIAPGEPQSINSLSLGSGSGTVQVNVRDTFV